MSIKALEARIVEAERKYETLRLAALDWGNGIDTHSRLIDKLWQRVEALEVAQQPRLSTAGPLVDRVQRKIDDHGCGQEARAAILEVAAWLTENYARDVASPPPCQVLRNEVNR